MALTRSRKTENVQKLASELQGSTSAIVGTFAKLTASKDFDLRKTIRIAGGSYHVVKNKLAARASQGTRIEAALQDLKGVSAVAYTSGDPVVLAKALSTWVKDNSEFTFKLAIVRWPAALGRRDRRPCNPAGQGRALFKASLPHQLASPAVGDRY